MWTVDTKVAEIAVIPPYPFLRDVAKVDKITQFQ